MKYTFAILILGLLSLGSFAVPVDHTSQYLTNETNTESVEIRLQEDLEEDAAIYLADLETRLNKIKAEIINYTKYMVKAMEDLKKGLAQESDKSIVLAIDKYIEGLNSISAGREYSAEETSVENGDRDQYGELQIQWRQ